MSGIIQAHNERASATWSAGGSNYDDVSKSIANALEHCVLRLDPKAGDNVLDLATGTGWTSRLLANMGVNVTGADIAKDLLASAKERAKAEQLTIDYQVGDAESLPFEDGEFDHVISTFGVMFASRPEAAAKELARICKKGGRIALTTWLPDSNVFKFFGVMRPYMQAPVQPSPPSPFEWGKRERIQELLGENFDMRFEDGINFQRAQDSEEIWNLMSTSYGPTKVLANSLEPHRLEEFHRDFLAFNDNFKTDLGISVPRTYLVAVGTKN